MPVEKIPPLLYQDRDLFVIDKPAGLAVQGGTRVKHHLTGMMRRAFPRIKPQAVHRLDAATSGIVLFAVSPEKMAEIKKKWDWAEKVYLAIIKGKFNRKMTRLANSIHIGEKEKYAVTGIYSHGSFGGFSLISATLGTGRMHQIRKQLAEAAHPILGDNKYGDYTLNRSWDKNLGTPRLFLHAWKLDLPLHKSKGKKMQFISPLPDIFMKVLQKYNAQAFSPDPSVKTAEKQSHKHDRLYNKNQP